MFRLYSGEILAGTQIFGFLAAEELAPKGRWPVITNARIAVLHANYSQFFMTTYRINAMFFARLYFPLGTGL